MEPPLRFREHVGSGHARDSSARQFVGAARNLFIPRGHGDWLVVFQAGEEQLGQARAVPGR